MKIDAIFIVGTGRSGTHFLCRSLRGFSNIDDFMDGKENHNIRVPLTKLAIKHQTLTNNIIDYYKFQIQKAKTEDKIFLDQLHTNLYHVDQLIKEFPKSLFLATDRPIEQIIASMLHHEGVRKWTKYAMHEPDAVFPNQFLGINSKQELQNLSTHVLCSKRVKAHNEYRDRLIAEYPNNVKKVNFINLVDGQYDYFQNLFSKKELELFGTYQEIEKADKSVLTKFKKDLDKKRLKEIK